MRKNHTRAMLAALALFIAAPAYADGPGLPEANYAAPPVRAAPVTAPPPAADPAAAPAGRTGVVPLGNGLSLNVPASYRFYSAEEAQRYLQRANQPAPGGVVYGLIARNGEDIRAPGTWATVVSYDAIGYVQSETSAGLSDANFEAQVAEARRTQRRRFESLASPPSFNAETPYLIWAENVAPPGEGGKDMRYEQKILGRSGVVGMTSIGAADQLPAMEAASTELRGMLTFPEGQRHADFQAASDTVSTYSVPGLVTGVPTAQPQAAADAATTGGTGQTAFGGLAGYFPWIALGVVLLAGVGYMAMRRRNDDDEDEATA